MQPYHGETKLGSKRKYLLISRSNLFIQKEREGGSTACEAAVMTKFKDFFACMRYIPPYVSPCPLFFLAISFFQVELKIKLNSIPFELELSSRPQVGH